MCLVIEQMTYRADGIQSKWRDRANGTRANGHRAYGNRANVVAQI